MNELRETLIVGGVAVALVLLVILALFLFKKLGVYLDIKAGAAADGSIQALLLNGAKEAYAWAEREGKGLSGSQKADVAYGYLADLLDNVGVNVDAKRIKSSVQLAWTTLEGIPRETNSISPQQVQNVIKKEFESAVKKEV